jgi:hypothetical protein
MRGYRGTLDAYIAVGAAHILYGLGVPFDLVAVEQVLA